jgi:hypothetical protein
VFFKNLAAAVLVAVYAFVMSYLIFLLLDKAVGVRAAEDHQRIGLDISFHGAMYFYSVHLGRIVPGRRYHCVALDVPSRFHLGGSRLDGCG